MQFDYDIIVIGAGHAGCEAAVAAARMGCRTLLITTDLNRVAQMSCNPAVGGIAKGQIVREIDALGGQMGIIADKTAIQFRMLNRSKGPAVWSPRVQSDREKFISEWRKVLESTPNLDLFQDTVKSLIIATIEDDSIAEEVVKKTEYNSSESILETNKNSFNSKNEESGLEVEEKETEIRFETNRYSVQGVITDLGFRFKGRKVILTAGTFLNGLMHFGELKIRGGRIAEIAETDISTQLQQIGFEILRMKTGTPARIDGRSIDFSLTQIQNGDDIVEEATTRISTSAGVIDFLSETANTDSSITASETLNRQQKTEVDRKNECEEDVKFTDEKRVVLIERDFHKFSFLPDVHRILPPRSCFIVHTNKESHRILHENIERSPLYNGQITSIGPRYCPSIETKIVTFADKDSHQLFLEPEGETTNEFYINGFSSSLPWEVQLESLQQIPALRNVHFYRPGYAIEYDYFDPTQLRHTLETKLVSNLYFAGQVNGTTGYEEAAGQGLMAGINAALSVKGEEPLVLGRDEAYIGVLIDDLITKGVDEPYRMFTSRAEYRILLRQDDADMRLTPIGHRIGLADDYRYQSMIEKKKFRDELIDFCNKFPVKSSEEINSFLEKEGTTPLTSTVRLTDLIKRPQLNIHLLSEVIPELKDRIDNIKSAISKETVEAAEILIKYEGYINRERDLADKSRRLEYVRIPANYDFRAVSALSTESRQKLEKHRPETIGQASRIPGVSPADINVLLILLGR